MEFPKKLAGYLVPQEVWPVALLLVASIGSSRLLPLTLIAAVLFWPARWLVTGKFSVRTPVDWSIFVIVILLPVTLWATALPEVTRPQVYRLLTGIAFFYALVNWASSPDRLRMLISGAVLAGLSLGSLALISVQWSRGKIPLIPKAIYNYLPNLISDTIHRSVMAGYLVILLPVGLAILLFAFNRLGFWERLIIIISATTMVVVLVLTQTRGAWAAFGVVLVLLIVLRWRFGWIVVPITMLVLIFVIYWMGGLDHIIALLSANTTVGGLNERIEIWSRALYMIRDFPLTGIGMGLFGPIADKFYPFFLSAAGTIPHAHNLYLQVAVDLGIPGLVAWLATLGGVVVTAWQLYRFGRRQEDAWIAGLGAGLLCSQVALMVQGLIDAVTWGMVRPAPLVWGVWGITVASWLVYVKPSLVPEIATSVEKGVPAIE